MTAQPSWIIFAGQAVPVGNATGVSVVGSGLWHSTGSVLDAIAYVGSANQIMATNSPPTDAVWVTVGGDLSYTGSGSFYVGSLSGGNGLGGQITINGTQLMFAADQTNPTVGQFTGSAATANNLLIQAQSTNAVGGTGGTLNLNSGAGATSNGAINLQVAGTTRLGINGQGTTITLTPTNLQWSATTSAPVISQATASGAATNFSILAQNAGGTNNGGNLILGPGAGSGGGTYGNITLQMASGAGNAFTLNGGSITWGASMAPQLNQFVSTGAANNFSIIAQSAGGSNNNGGNLTIQSGASTGTGTGGTLILGTGTSASGIDGSIQMSIGGTTTLTLLGSVNSTDPGALGILQWATGCGTPSIQHNIISSQIKGTDFLIQPQQSSHATDQGGGNLVIGLQAPSGAGAEAFVQVKRGSTKMVQIGQTSGSTSAIFMVPGANTASANPTIAQSSTTLTITGSGGGSAYFGVNNSTAKSFLINDTGSPCLAQFGSSLQICGNTAALQWGVGTQSLAAGGTIALVNTVYQNPIIEFSGSMPNNTTVTFPTTNTWYFLDFTGVTFNAHNLIFSAGTGSKSVTVTSTGCCWLYVAASGNSVYSVNVT